MRGLTFTYTHAERVETSNRTPYRHVERWAVDVRIDDPLSQDHGRLVGDASVIILNIEPGRDVGDLADAAAGEWRTLTAVLGAEAPGAGGEAPADHLLVLERVRVEPKYRGEGLGPIIAAAVIERLRRGCRMAACFPAPFEGPCRPEDHDFEVEALSRIWAKVGFRHWRDGVCMLDLDGSGLTSSASQF